ncbi:hypothetical protein [Pyrodictium abyssi]
MFGGISEDRKKEVTRELSKLLGLEVVGARVGDNGFDLIFDDGTELEVYCFPKPRSSGPTRGDEGVKPDCCWGIVVAKYRRYKVESLEEAERIVEELTRNQIDATIVGPLLDGTIYFGIREDLIEETKKLCSKLSSLTRKYIC